MSDCQLPAISAGSQVGVFEATKEQSVPENMPLNSLQGRFCKTLGSQVFTSRPDSLRYRQTLPYLSTLLFFPSDRHTPGEVLKDELEYRKYQKQLATEMGISYTLLNEVQKARYLNLQQKFVVVEVERPAGLESGGLQAADLFESEFRA